MSEQIKKKLDKVTITKIAKGAGIAGGGVALLYILQALTSADFGNYTPIVTALLAVLINAVKEYLKGK